MKKKMNEPKNANKSKSKSYTDEEQNQFMNNLAQVIKSSKYNDKDNEDM